MQLGNVCRSQTRAVSAGVDAHSTPVYPNPGQAACRTTFLSKLRSRRVSVTASAHGEHDPPRLPKLKRIAVVPPTQQSQPADVDQDLWEVLELCSEEELEEVHSILYGPSPLSPVVKSLVVDNEPPAVDRLGRKSLMRRIETRFRFLAADARCMIRGRRPSYRESLLSVRDRLEVDCPTTLPTQELETEIFVHMLQRYSDSDSPAKAEGDSAVNAFAVGTESDGMAPPRQPFGGHSWAQALEQVAAPIKLGGSELVPALMKLGSALTVSSVKTSTVRTLGATLLRQHLQHEAALAACRGAVSTTTRQAALKASQQGLTAAAARYGLARGMLATLGPIMWGAAIAEIALASLGTDYGRLVRAIHMLAQVRLVRTYGWTTR